MGADVRRKEPGHQQPWYLLYQTELIRSLHAKGINILQTTQAYDSFTKATIKFRFIEYQ